MFLVVLAGVLLVMALVSWLVYRRPRSLHNDTSDMSTKHQISSENAHVAENPAYGGYSGLDR